MSRIKLSAAPIFKLPITLSPYLAPSSPVLHKYADNHNHLSKAMVASVLTQSSEVDEIHVFCPPDHENRMSPFLKLTYLFGDPLLLVRRIIRP